MYTVRALACLSIVWLHSMQAVARLHPDMTGELWDSVAIIFSVGTPVFVMVTAFLLGYAYGVSRPLPTGTFRRRCAVLLPPFVAMAVFYGLLSWYIDELSWAGFVGQVLANVFLASYHGYFILIVLQFVAIFPFCMRLVRRFGWPVVFVCGALANVAWLGFFNLVPAQSGWEALWERISWLPFPGWILYFLIAVYFGMNYPKVREQLSKHQVFLYASTLGVAAGIVLLHYTRVAPLDSSKRLDMLVLAPLVFLCFFALGRRGNSPGWLVERVAEYSFGIYLLHFFAIAVMDSFAEPLLGALGPLLYAAVLMCCAVVVAAAITVVIQSMPGGALVVGPPGRRTAGGARRRNAPRQTQ
ncbi:acyltransferase family protein [Microbacterium sp. SSW1-59]|uniref:acyltransferase family protein n=1 Tax=Microbacterium xanthum TaxID=3079794 RepID=UPI002AD48421|nr:acyltransferase family protein [Microbacterium sp. SSW1-59]MDZ8201266.1 acyltransferase family protein [Microbacterium sp. SSW1-59]